MRLVRRRTALLVVVGDSHRDFTPDPKLTAQRSEQTRHIRLGYIESRIDPFSALTKNNVLTGDIVVRYGIENSEPHFSLFLQAIPGCIGLMEHSRRKFP